MKFIFSKIKIFNIKTDEIKKIPWVLGLNAFWIIIFLVFIEIAVGEFLFYKYVFLVEKDELKTVDYNLKFKNNIYQSVLEKWQEKDQKFEDYKIEQYSNPFIVTKTKEVYDLTIESDNLTNPKPTSGPVIR